MNSSLENLTSNATTVIARLVRATQLLFSRNERWVARMKRAMTVARWERTIVSSILAISLALSLSSCGVKNDLVLPDGKPSPKGEKDPSKPPQQQQR